MLTFVSRANVGGSVASLNQRNASNACAYGVAARCYGRRSCSLRCAASQRDTRNTVCSETSRVAL
jgi:hypothetical protein